MRTMILTVAILTGCVGAGGGFGGACEPSEDGAPCCYVEMCSDGVESYDEDGSLVGVHCPDGSAFKLHPDGHLVSRQTTDRRDIMCSSEYWALRVHDVDQGCSICYTNGIRTDCPQGHTECD